MTKIDPVPLVTLFIFFSIFIIVGLAIGIVEALGTLLQ